MSETTSPDKLRVTPLYDLHQACGARMVPFAGYHMPVQFDGVKVEHLWTRSHAGLFDVSHMGPCYLRLIDTSLRGDAAHKAVSALIEQLVPSAIATLTPGQARLTVLLDQYGGILDDLIITRPAEPELQGQLYIVVNGAVKAQDWALFDRTFDGQAELVTADEQCLLALQGPEAEAVLATEIDGCTALSFMQSGLFEWGGQPVRVSRLGYTGEDGFELLVPAEAGIALSQRLLADDRVKPIGLGARDSLRLESGLCLYGHDITADHEPVEAGLQWVIQKSRRESGDFPGAKRILSALQNGPEQKRVGIRPLERAPAREGTEIYHDGQIVGQVTSGGFSPSLEIPIAMGYVRADLGLDGTRIELMVRGKLRPAEICQLPFVQQNYKR